MKKSVINIVIVVGIIGILLFLSGKFLQSDEIDFCLDRGYCWDYIRNRCEEQNQGFCVKSEQDCLDRNGKWQKDKQYCILP